MKRTRNRRTSSPGIEPLEVRSLLSMQGGLAFGAFDALRVDPASYDPSRILVRYRPEAIGGAGAELGLVPGLREVPIAEGQDVEAALRAFRADPNVLYAQPDYVVRIDETRMPDDPGFVDGSQWALNNTGQSEGTSDADIDAPEAWAIGTGTGSMVVAVIDTGIQYTHPDLAANIWVNAREVPDDGLDNDGNGFIDDVHGYDFANDDGDPWDDHGHGTHVAGTIGAVGDNGIGVVGVAWNVQIMALKFLGADGRGTTSDAILAIDYAVRMGAKISNNSYGGDSYDPAFEDALRAAGDAGHIFVAAAGNNGKDIDAQPGAYYPAAYNLPNVVTVAATNRNDQRASSSNYGATTVELGAPGVSIYSTTVGNRYGLSSGTSMAAPHVAGALALVWDTHPTWTYDQVVARVLETVDVIPALEGRTVSGGRLNVHRALEAPSPTPGVIDFAFASITHHDAAAQGTDGSATAEDGGATLHLAGNTWRKIPLPYTVTPETILEFDFRSPRQGDIQGIGLDHDDTATEARVFRLYGTQRWGRGRYDTYAEQGPGWVHYRIPVGEHFTGAMAYLTFVNDHDVNDPDAEAFFRNVRIYEASTITASSGASIAASPLGAAHPSGDVTWSARRPRFDVPAVPPGALAFRPGDLEATPAGPARWTQFGPGDDTLLTAPARDWLLGRRRR